MPQNQKMDDRRADPRTEIGLGKSMNVQYPNRVAIVDISKSGAKFLSEQPFDVGTMIKIGTGLLTMDVKILECSQVEVDQGLMEFRYQVRCQFDPHDIFAGEEFFEMLVHQ